MKKSIILFFLFGIFFFFFSINPTCSSAVKKPLIKKKSPVEKLLSQAYKKQKAQKYSQAIEIYKKIIKKNPQSINSYIALGKIYIKIEKLDKAMAVQKKLKEINPIEAKILQKKINSHRTKN